MRKQCSRAASANAGSHLSCPAPACIRAKFANANNCSASAGRTRPGCCPLRASCVHADTPIAAARHATSAQPPALFIIIMPSLNPTAPPMSLYSGIAHVPIRVFPRVASLSRISERAAQARAPPAPCCGRHHSSCRIHLLRHCCSLDRALQSLCHRSSASSSRTIPRSLGWHRRTRPRYFLPPTLGARISLAVSVTVVSISFALGLAIGGLAGYIGGWVDTALTTFAVNTFLALPGILLAIAFAAFLGPGFSN